MLEISRIKVGAQARASVSEPTVQRYAEHLTDGGTFPPIVVFYDSTDYWLADGHHRLLAHQRIGFLTILEDIQVGTKRDAMKYALGANSVHGLQRSNADKRRAVEIAMTDQEWSRLPARELAKLCNVSHNLVAEMRNGGTAAKKTAKNKKVSPDDKPVVDKPAAKVSPDDSKTEDPAVSPDDNDYSEVQMLRDQIADLQDQIALGFFVGGDDERNLAKNTIAALRGEVKTLNATNAAIKSSLDESMRENTQLKAQIKRLEKKVA